MSLFAATSFGKLLDDNGWIKRYTLASFVYYYYFFPNQRIITIQSARENILKDAIKILGEDRFAKKAIYNELVRRIKKNHLKIEKMPFLLREFFLFGRMIKNSFKYAFYLLKGMLT